MRDELLDGLGVRVGLLLHDRIGREARGLPCLRTFDYAAGDADYRGARGHFPDHDGVGPDVSAIADGEPAEDLGARAHDYAGPERRMALRAAIERRAAQRDPLVDRAAIADLGGFADYYPHAVIDEHARA